MDLFVSFVVRPPSGGVPQPRGKAFFVNAVGNTPLTAIRISIKCTSLLRIVLCCLFLVHDLRLKAIFESFIKIP